MTQFNKLNMDMLDIKQENQGLKEQKLEFLAKIDVEKSEKIGTVCHIVSFELFQSHQSEYENFTF
jgi:hypothetical protein